MAHSFSCCGLRIWYFVLIFYNILNEIGNNFYKFSFFQDKSKDSKANPLSVKNIGKRQVIIAIKLI